MGSDCTLLLAHILDGKEYRPLLTSPDVAQHRTNWRQLIRHLIVCPPQDRTTVDRFHTQWHTSHHYIRALVDDDALLMDMLWVWLPRYEGPELVLYRGENIDRLERASLGTAWTNTEDTAQVFASGLNAVGSGGVILQARVPVDAIIAGPSEHSRYLGEHEYTIDSRRLGAVLQLRRFPRHT